MIIINKSITQETFKNLLEMYKRQGIKVTNKVVDDEFISYVAEGFQYIYTKDIKTFPVDLIVSDSDLYEKSLYLNDLNGLNGFINETKNINRKIMVESEFDFSKKEVNVMPDVKIGNSVISYGYSDGKLKIYSLRTPISKRGGGSARLAMQEFLKYADEAGIDVYLDSSPLDNRTNGNKLIKFYQSLGFKKTGKVINPAGDPEMVRVSNNQLKESVELIAKDYIKCHGKNPAGIGTWIFGIGSKKSSDWVEFKGKFSEAKKKAIKQAEEKSVSKIYVMESLSNENIDLHYDIKLNPKGYRVAIIKENNEIAVTQAITLSGAESIAKKLIHNILIDAVPKKSEFNIKEFKESVNKFKDVNEDLIQKTEQSIRIPFKAVKVDSYYMIKDNLGQYLHGEYTKEDADNLVKQLNAIGNVQFSINESVKSFEIKYRSTSDSSKTEGSKVITAPDQNVARKRFTEDNPELKNLQIISITEVTDKI